MSPSATPGGGLPTRSRVAVIGPGRVGTTLAAALTRAGHRVVAVAGGSDASRERFRGVVAGVRPLAPDAAVADADLVLLTTPDDVLEEVVTGLAVAGVLGERHHVVHTAGSLGLAPLRRAALAGARVAACHPAQTFPAGRVDPDALVGVSWAVTAPAGDRAWAHDLVVTLGGTPHDLAEAHRTLYHAALTVGSNAVAATVSVARQLLICAGIEEVDGFLRPLVEASVGNVLASGADAITGPVVRGDVGTVARHLTRLDADVPALAGAYRALSRVVLGQVRPALRQDTAAALDALLADPQAPEDHGRDDPGRDDHRGGDAG